MERSNKAADSSFWVETAMADDDVSTYIQGVLVRDVLDDLRHESRPSSKDARAHRIARARYQSVWGVVDSAPTSMG